MERMPYFVMAGVVLVSIGIAIVFSGWFWIVPVAAAVIVAIYAAWDRRQRKDEGRGERLMAR